MNILRGVLRLLLVLWAGSAWSLAAWVTPTLFFAQNDRQLAGFLAARLFTLETCLGLGVAAAALVLAQGARFRWGYVAAGLLAANEWALKPMMERAHEHGAALGLGFGAWHGVSALIYIGACLALAVPIWRGEFSRRSECARGEKDQSGSSIFGNS